MSEIVPFQQRGVVEVGSGVPVFDPGEPAGGYEPDTGAQIRSSVAMLLRHKWMVLAAGLAGLAGAGYLVLSEPPVYQSNAVIRLQDKTKSLNPMDQTAERMIGRMSDPLFSALEIMRSRTVLGAAVDHGGLRLAAAPGFPWGVVQGVKVDSAASSDTLAVRFTSAGVEARGRDGRRASAPYGQPLTVGGATFTVARRPSQEEAELYVVSRGAAVGQLIGSLRAGPRDKTDVVDVSYRAQDPAMAQRSLNAVLAAFQEYGTQRAQTESRRRRVFVEEQLGRTVSQLAQAQDQLSAFRSGQRVYSSQQKAAAQQEGMMALQVRRDELAAERQSYATLLQQYRSAPAGEKGERLRALVSEPGIAANPVVSAQYGQLVRYEMSRDSMSSGEWASAAQHPDLARLNGLIATTEGRIVNAVESQMRALDARLGSLGGVAARSAGEMQSLPASEAREVRLVQEVEALQKVADQLRAEYQKALISEAVEAGVVDIVDAASTPGAPIGEGRAPKLLIGLLLGLVAGSGAAFLREAMNTSLRRREDIESLLQVPGLAVIPRIAVGPGAAAQRTGVRKLLPLAARNGNGNGNGHANGNGNGATGAAALVALSDARSSAAEAYRTLRTNLIFSQTGRALRTLVVTSASPAEGKSTTSSNLAAAYAQQGIRVLIMDCDLRRPRLNEVFAVPREPGITQVVVGQKKLSDVVQATPVENLFVATAGTLPPNPSEILGSDAMKKLLAQAATEFDLVILDTPPVLVASDAAIIGSMTDGVVLVVRAGKTDRSEAQQALRQLTTVGARVLGATLNDPDHKAARYGGYYAYDYYGGYGTSDG